MFDRSGEKVKTVAKTIYYIMVVIAVIILFLGLFMAANSPYGGGVIAFYTILSAGVIILSAWISSLFFTAFGDLVNSNEKIVDLLEQIINGEYRRISTSEKNDTSSEK